MAHDSTLDLIDRKIVAILMADAKTPIAQIADRVGLSQTPCWKRIQKLEASGVIQSRVALVDPGALGLALTVFVGIEAPDHGSAWRDAFLAELRSSPEVTGVWRMAGDPDYLIRVAVPDIQGFDRFYKSLTDALPIRDVTSHIAMECLYQTSAYPVDTLSR